MSLLNPGQRLSHARFEYTCGKLLLCMSDRQERINTIRTIGALSTVGFSFVLAVIIGAALGWWLDRLFGFDEYPVFFLLFFVLGRVAGVLNVFRASKKLK